jgi:ComF family protein
MAERMTSMPLDSPFDVVLPVPLHRSRQRRRGFNQAEELLRYLDWPRAEGTLRRVRKTSSQVGRGVGDRRRNVSGAFEYDGPRLDGVRVALLDDVVTTGATAIECARVLHDAGARSIVAFAFARAGGTAHGDDRPIFDDA